MDQEKFSKFEKKKSPSTEIILWQFFTLIWRVKVHSLNSFIGFEQLHLEVILAVATKLNWQIVWVEQFTLALDLNFVESQHFHQIKVLYHKLQGAKYTRTICVNIGRSSTISCLAKNTCQKSRSTIWRHWFTSLKWVWVTDT